MRGKLENPLPKFHSTNFLARLKDSVYWILWAITGSVILGSSVGCLIWMIFVYGVYEPKWPNTRNARFTVQLNGQYMTQTRECFTFSIMERKLCNSSIMGCRYLMTIFMKELMMRKFTSDDTTLMMVLSLSLVAVLIFVICAAAYFWDRGGRCDGLD